MRRVADEDATVQLGDFYWYIDQINGERYIMMLIPCVSRANYTHCNIPVRPAKLENGHSWEWDGNEDKPTLTPSVHAVGVWHGWIREGVMSEA